MDRVVLNQGGTLTASWEIDGSSEDPGTVTVTITRDDGTALVTGGPTSPGTTSADREYVLAPAQVPQLDRFTCVWSSSAGSKVTTYAEVVGGFLFTIARARTRAPLQDTAAYPTAQLVYYRTLAEIALEDIAGVAFVPRYSRSMASISNTGLFSLPRRHITAVRNVWTTSDSGPVAVPNLNGLRIMNGGSIWMPALFNFWSSPVTVGYEHGGLETSPRVARAALELARRWIVESPWDERMVGYRSRDGGELSILTANHSDPFDIPEVVAVADAYGTPMIR